MSFRIAVLTVGDELLSGEMADTNTAAIARFLGERGYRLRESLTVGDEEDDITEALQALTSRNDLVLVTGGLGPTEDDLTARAAARAFGRAPALNSQALALIRDFFRRTGHPMLPRNEKQAILPTDAEILPNAVGTAPGFRLHHQGKDVFFFPGVSAEMIRMLSESLLPWLQRKGGAIPAEERVLTIFGLAEPAVEERIAGADLPDGTRIAFGVDFPLVYLKLRASGEQARTLLDRAEGVARDVLGENVVATGKAELATAVARLLTQQGRTLSLAESCTGGLVAKMLTDPPGASAFLERGAVTYANSAKRDWLLVPQEVLERNGAVSAECARAMAEGIRTCAGTDFGMAITGIAGPEGGTAEKPVGTVYLALVDAVAQRIERCHFAGDRDQVRLMAANTALDWLRRRLLSAGGEP